MHDMRLMYHSVPEKVRPAFNIFLPDNWGMEIYVPERCTLVEIKEDTLMNVLQKLNHGVIRRLLASFWFELVQREYIRNKGKKMIKRLRNR